MVTICCRWLFINDSSMYNEFNRPIHEKPMLEQINPLWPAFLKARQNAEPLVLATLFRVNGSSYKKPGAMMLIAADRTTHGLLSGGCLEADIAEHAMDVFDTASAQVLTYDLSDDSLFGLGAGCDGTIDILLQLLDEDYLPFSALNPLPGEARDTRLTLRWAADGELPAGGWLLDQHDQQRASHPAMENTAEHGTVTLPYQRPPRVVIMGAGFDAAAVCQQVLFSQWHCWLMDHREGRLIPDNHHPGVNLLHQPLSNQQLVEADFDAAIIMSHNIDQDAHYLQLVSQTDIPFVGLLGPVARRDKVLHKAGHSAADWHTRLHAPVGVPLGGRLPEHIAVSIIAELQAWFYRP
jgi:xanthine dehydrogenase accessory factor